MDKQDILDDFHQYNFELCYEITTHKKVYNADVILAIPEGTKCFAWFTTYKETNLCVIINNDNTNNDNTNKDNTNNANKVKIVKTSFTDKLCYGTIFYGTSFKHNKMDCFCIEDIYYYKGKYIGNINYSEKLRTIKEIFETSLSQIALIKSYTIFGLPFITSDIDTMLRDVPLLPYKVSDIKFRYFDKTKIRKIMSMKYFSSSKKIQAIFKVTPDMEPDIYNLFIYNNGKFEYYDVAHISDYNTSKMMNKLFRNIKENDNLDTIEESDSETEFEDSRDDKYVYLNRELKMVCDFNSKFKRWSPISLAKNTDKVATLSIINALLKNN